MKRIPLYILLLCSHIAVAQVSDDSLKNICKELYQSQEKNKPGTYRIHPVEEVFAGYFKNVKVFLVSCQHSLMGDSTKMSFHDAYSYSFYLLKTETGRNVELNGIEDFNAVFEEQRPVCNLDKCYLYLLLVEKTTNNLTSPRDYRKILSNNSVFLKDALPYQAHHQYGVVYHRSDILKKQEGRLQLDEDISSSTRNYINIHTVSGEAIYRHQFLFNRDGKVRSVSKTLIK